METIYESVRIYDAPWLVYVYKDGYFGDFYHDRGGYSDPHFYAHYPGMDPLAPIEVDNASSCTLDTDHVFSRVESQVSVHFRSHGLRLVNGWHAATCTSVHEFLLVWILLIR